MKQTKKRRTSRRFLGVVAVLMGLSAGCEVGPDYRAPKVAVKPAFGEPATQPSTRPAGEAKANPAQVARWWLLFHDPELNSLVHRAIERNLDLSNAESRLRQARAQRGIVGAGLFPEVNADGGYQLARGSKNVSFPLSVLGLPSNGSGASPATATPSASPLAVRPFQATSGGSVSPAETSAPPGGPQSPLGLGGLPGATTDLYQAGFDASWELDIFGGVRRSMEAADADTQAALEDRRDVLISLVAEVAGDYIALRTNQRQEQIAEQNLRDEEETLELTRSRYKAGFATELDVARQATQVATTEASLPALQAAIRGSIHALSVLLALDPDALSRELSAVAAIPPAPPVVPVGVPADLLRRRPDIRRAERELAAATARIGVATADLYPKFSITGSFGLDSSEVKRLMDWNSQYFLLSPGVSWPIFDAGRIRANINVQKELTRQAATNYQAAVLNALREVEDALVSYRNEQTRRKALADAVDTSREAADLSRQQYEKGVADFLVVLDAERSVLEAQDMLAQSDSAISMDLVALYKALGGGWETDAATQ